VFVGREATNSTNVLTSLISNETSTLEGISFDLQFSNQTNFINSTSLVGKFNSENLSISLIVATILTNIPLQFFASACKSITAAPGRMESVLLQKGVRAFVDYAHTPDALEKVLLTAKENISNGKLIVVFGCGGNRDVTKRPQMGAIASSIADLVIITNDNPREEEPRAIMNNIIAGIPKDNHNYTVIENRADAIQYAVDCSNQGDCIVIAGKGHENYQITGTTKTHFSDQEELIKYQ
jgi:UDP-N-acetylmuramoyl-L-alanyl-D-glutamate--2,6-diaminopimelate ligase